MTFKPAVSAIYLVINGGNINDSTGTYKFAFNKIKLEKGNRATDWSPAPQDIDASITAVDNKFVNYSTTTQMNSAINQKANEITSTVSETYATKAALNTVDGKFANYSTTSAMNSAINQKANEITSSVSETYTTKVDFNGLAIGGANLLLKTKNFDDPLGAQAKVSETYRGLTVRGSNSIPYVNTVVCEYVFTDFDYNDIFTFSFYAKGNLTNLRAYFYGSQGYVRAYAIQNSVGAKANGSGDGYSNFGAMTNEWKRYWVTWRIDTSGDKSIRKNILLRTDGSNVGESIYVCGCKFERGNKATEWTPAPQDIDSAITAVDGKFTNYSTTSQMNSAINQKANEITSTVSSLDTKFTTNYANTVINSSTEFYLSTSNTTQINGAWSDVPSDVSQGTFLWSRTKNTKGDGSVSYTEPICVTDDTSDGYIIVLSRENQTVYCDANGNPI